MTGPGLSTTRSISNTPADHVADHNLIHQAVDLLDLTTAPVLRGAVVFNVKDYGAVGDWSSGTSGTDDLTAINAALTAAAAAVTAGVAAARVLVPWTTGNGYKFTDTITTPAGVEWDMRAPLVYAGPGAETALIIGSGTAQSRRQHTVMLQRYTISDWTSETDAGLVIHNHYASTFNIVQCDQFTVGVTCMGDTSNGFSYNKVHIGQLTDNKIALDLTNDTAGWCNENQYYGGRFTVQSATYTTLDRVGVRITSRAGTKYYNNANTFYSPSFELKGGAIAADSICLLVEYGLNNEATRARHESNSPLVLRQQNDSANNWIDFQMSDEGAVAPAFSAEGTSAGGGLTRKNTANVDRSMRVIYKADNLHLKACYYDGATSINVPGVTVGTSGTTNTDARAASSLVLNANYLEIPNTRYVGFYMSTRELKRFAVLREAESGFGGRIMIRAYDSGGTIISTAGAVQTAKVADNPVFATSYGGAWRLGNDSNAAYFFGVSAAVDYVFIGVCGGSAAARIRSLSVATLDSTNPACWLAFPDNSFNYATSIPTSGTWAVGRLLFNAAPTTSGPVGWVCTAAGTPGTWRSFGDVSGATQIDAITATGTWTKPAGAKAHQVIMMGGGGGGGSGRRGAAASVRCGGGGGAGGALTIVDLDAADVPSSHTVTVGAGGTGGAAVTANDTNGNAGGLGGGTLFGALVAAYAGTTAAAGGTAAAGAGGSAATGLSAGGAGGTASTTGGVGGNGVTGGGGGGGAGSGGGITSGDVAANGGIGLISRIAANSNASGGVVDSTAPQSGTAPTAKGIPGQGGGGGAASITTVAQAGATPTGFGGGGGGGGASLNGNNSGAGATGAPGYCLVISTF